MFKTALLFAAILVSGSVQAKVLICGDQQVKYGFSSESKELYVAEAKTPDSAVVQKGNEHGRMSVAYDAIHDVFTASGEDGCVQVDMITQLVDGKVQLLETDDYDGITTIIYECRQYQ